MLPIIPSVSQALSQFPPRSSPAPCPQHCQSDKILPHAQDAWWGSRDALVGGASHVDGGPCQGGWDVLGWVSWGPVHIGTNHCFFAVWSQIDTIPSPPTDANMLCLCEGQSPLCTDRCVQRTPDGTPVSSLATHSPPHSPAASA